MDVADFIVDHQRDIDADNGDVVSCNLIFQEILHTGTGNGDLYFCSFRATQFPGRLIHSQSNGRAVTDHDDAIVCENTEHRCRTTSHRLEHDDGIIQGANREADPLIVSLHVLGIALECLGLEINGVRIKLLNEPVDGAIGQLFRVDLIHVILVRENKHILELVDLIIDVVRGNQVLPLKADEHPGYHNHHHRPHRKPFLHHTTSLLINSAAFVCLLTFFQRAGPLNRSHLRPSSVPRDLRSFVLVSTVRIVRKITVRGKPFVACSRWSAERPFGRRVRDARSSRTMAIARLPAESACIQRRESCCWRSFQTSCTCGSSVRRPLTTSRIA